MHVYLMKLLAENIQIGAVAQALPLQTPTVSPMKTLVSFNPPDKRLFISKVDRNTVDCNTVGG